MLCKLLEPYSHWNVNWHIIFEKKMIEITGVAGMRIHPRFP
ncbi:hypothetical protein CEV32_0542 [Brucella rhizosphaerae]|uniref:Uncharacterized protein n=1 Tax=Brucella rhizosphaerae TaxID=571254 RepID=A0A256FI61_9HYPH|nr:hypothetical protein CEV32_0542 [Brucella rhizosphaerae]